jgi:hypothetical protein
MPPKGKMDKQAKKLAMMKTTRLPKHKKKRDEEEAEEEAEEGDQGKRRKEDEGEELLPELGSDKGKGRGKNLPHQTADTQVTTVQAAGMLL